MATDSTIGVGERNRPRVVIVGAGFGGLWAARALARSPFDVLLIDRNNYHVFWPLLYQIGAAEIEATEIAYPVRSILRGYPNVRFLMAEARELDTGARLLRVDGHELRYDKLIVALGSTSHFLGVEGAAEHSFPIKTLDDGLELRNQILSRFELCLRQPDPERRRRMLTFVIVGGGPTGVEYAGALMELIRTPLRKDFPELDFAEASVVLLEATDSLLPGFEAKLSRYAAERLRRMGVDLRMGAQVSAVTPGEVRLEDGTVIPTETVAWTAGVQGHPLVRDWGLPADRKGRVEVDELLQVRGVPDVYVVGDLALVEQDGAPLPMVAPVATQQGETVAKNLLRTLRGEEPRPFVYRDPGMMATIGRNKAIATIRGRSFTGYFAWVAWVLVHIAKLIGFRNKLLVLVNWAADYFFFERAIRLILPFQQIRDVLAPGDEPEREQPAGPPADAERQESLAERRVSSR